ncbi:unnamed protein product, partial [Urochloa humidicola]
QRAAAGGISRPIRHVSPHPSRRWETPTRCRCAPDPVTGSRIRTRDEVDLGAATASRAGPPSRNISSSPHPHHTDRPRRRSRRRQRRRGGRPRAGTSLATSNPARHGTSPEPATSSGIEYGRQRSKGCSRAILWRLQSAPTPTKAGAHNSRSTAAVAAAAATAYGLHLKPTLSSRWRYVRWESGPSCLHVRRNRRRGCGDVAQHA